MNRVIITCVIALAKVVLVRDESAQLSSNWCPHAIEPFIYWYLGSVFLGNLRAQSAEPLNGISGNVFGCWARQSFVWRAQTKDSGQSFVTR